MKAPAGFIASGWAGFIAMLVVGIGHTFNYHRDFDIPADDVIRAEDARTKLLAGAK